MLFLTKGTSVHVSGNITQQETQFRLLASENRERRRLLSHSAIELLNQDKLKICTSRIIYSIDNSLPTYVFIYFIKDAKTSTKQHERKVHQLIEDFLYATTTKTRNSAPVVGILFKSKDGKQIIGSVFPSTFTDNERRISKIKLKYLEDSGMYKYDKILTDLYNGYAELVQLNQK